MSTAILSSCLFLIIPFALGQAAEAPRLAEPPKWTEDELNVFFDDAREQLVGLRPLPIAQGGVGQLAAESPSGVQSEGTKGLKNGPSASRRWSQLIGAETLTAEIKRINNQLTAALKTSVSYQGGGNLLCQRDFGLLAVLFGIISEYDTASFNQSDRWQRSASFMQDRCFQAVEKCEAASAAGYAAAKEMHAMLGELIRGQVPVGGDANNLAEQQSLVDLSHLMQSLELALKQRISPAIASAREFRRRSPLAWQQAELLAVLAEVLQQAEYDHTDDDTYIAEARKLGAAARELAVAAREKNYEIARAAAGQVSQSCSRCHEGFRG